MTSIRKLHTNLPKEIHKKLKLQSVEEELTIAKMLEKMILFYLDNYKSEQKEE